MSLFDKLFKKKSVGQEPEIGPVEIDEMTLKGFYSTESVFRNQSWDFPRFSAEHPATLGETLSVLVDGIQDSFKSLRAFSEGDIILEDNDRRSIARTQLFPLLLGDDGVSGGFSRNVVLLVGLADGLPMKELVLHLKGTYGLPGRCCCMRVSLMVPPGEGEDSLHSCRPGTDESIAGKEYGQYSASFLLMQDNSDIREYLREFEKCESSMKEKEKRHEELSEMEKEISKGRWEIADPDYDFGYGRWLMEQERWYDAFRRLVRIYYRFQPFILNEKEDSPAVGFYVHVAHLVGQCLHKMGRMDEAFYFLSLASDSLDEAYPEYSELLAEMMDVRTSKDDLELLERSREAGIESTAGPYAPKGISVGFLMQELFRAPEGSLTSLTVFRDGSKDVFKVEKAGRTWDYPLLSLAEDGITAVIGYSPVTYVTGNDADKSILISGNAAVLRVKKAETGKDDSLFRFYVMVPPAPFDPQKMIPVSENIPEGFSFLVGGEGAGLPDTVDPDEVGAFASSLATGGRFLESFRAARFAVEYYMARWPSLSDDDKRAFFDALYTAGYSLMDFKIPEKANYYLGIAAETHASQYVQEYINCLANSHDPRTLAIIDHAISMEVAGNPDAAAVERWRLFLKRRKAYILTDARRFVEAEILLQELLNCSDEITRRFARSELQYVIEQKQKG